MCVLAPANLCPCETWSLCVFGVRSHHVHRATVLLRVTSVVAFYAAVGLWELRLRSTASVPAGVHW